MGKEKIEEKDVRLLRYAVEQAFDGAMRDGALSLLNRLVDSASEAANLEEELLNLKGEYQRSMENSKRGAFKRLDAAYKRKPGKYRDRKRTRDGYQGAHGHLAYDFGLILGDILVYCYREHVRYRSFLTREGTPVDTGLEVHGSTHDDGTADNHGEGTGELTAAALHTVLDGKAKVHKAEDDEDAAEGGHTIREKVFHVFKHV